MLEPINVLDQDYICPNWQEMGELTIDLAEKINQTGEKYDRLIALAKGGWGWARQLQDALGMTELASIQIQFYQGIGETKKSPIVIQSLPISVKNESILVYDDVADSGETLELAKDYLKVHGAKNVDTATHFTKSWTKHHPTYSAMDTDAWIIFPHDAVEMVQLLIGKWTDMTNKEVRENLEKIGIEGRIIDFALQSYL